MSSSKRIIPGTNAILLNSDGTFLSQHKVLVQPLTDTTTTFQVFDADGGNPVLSVDTVNERVGIGTATPETPVHIVAPLGDAIANIPFTFERNSNSTNIAVSSMRSIAISSGNMADGFGPRFLFQIEDDTAGPNLIGSFEFYRDGSDTTGAFRILAGGNGTAARMYIDGTGLASFGSPAQVPRAALQIGDPSTAATTIAPSGIVNSNNTSSLLLLENDAVSSSSGGAGVFLYHNDGAAMASGHRLAFILMGGSSAAASLRNAANIVAYAAENWIDGAAYGSNIQFQTTALGTTSRTTKLTVGGDGDILIDGFTSTTVGLTVKTAAAQTANALEVQDSAGNVLSGVDERGILFSDGNSVATNYFAGALAGNVAATGASNTVLGYNAGNSLTTGNNNVLAGQGAGGSLQDGVQNVAIGTSALASSVDGSDNFALGRFALNASTSDDDNVAIGTNAMSKADGSGDCVAIGTSAYTNLTTGDQNVGVGFQVDAYNQTGSGNVILGYRAGFGIAVHSKTDNVIIGFQAGYTVTGNRNIFLGNEAGYRQAAVSDTLVIDSVRRADAATELTHAILYGTMAANPEDQQLTINVDSLTVGTDANADVAANFTTDTNNGLFTWMRDEDYFDFADTLKTSAARIKSTTRIDSGDSPYTTLNTDDVIFADTDGGAITVNLQAGVEGRRLRIINVGTSGNDVTVEGDGAETVMGAANQTLADGEIVIIVYNAVEGWW